MGQFNRHGIGLMLSSCGVILSHNLIHDMPRCGVFYGGVLNTLEYNRIRRCNPEKKYIKYACVRSEPFEFTPGKDYRLSFRLLTSDASGSMTTRLVSETGGLWKALGSKYFRPENGERTECQLTFHYPAPGEDRYDERLGKLDIQFQFASKTGAAEISDLRLEEVLPASEWEAWQEAGGDVHSIVADPLFVDVEHSDFRLKPDSPALKQGFEPIPLDKIGPYKDDTRATWPIQEAEGVREHPEWLRSVPIGDE